jgi:hypothetical protein
MSFMPREHPAIAQKNCERFRTAPLNYLPELLGNLIQCLFGLDLRIGPIRHALQRM